jgi:hypothetical protein
MDDERVHESILRFDIDMLFDHDFDLVNADGRARNLR